MTVATMIAAVLLAASVVLVVVRLLRGPTVADRVLALDVLAYLVICLIGLHVLRTGHTAHLDAAATLALLGFVATIGFARHVERTSKGDTR